ncbi:MAG: acyltransferase [Myxococcales bacterium]
MPALDGVRGLAIGMVLLLHFVGNTIPTTAAEHAVVWATNYGAYGVDLFFVLSGYLITGILFDSRRSPRYFRNFYMRRVLRIFPLYYGVLAALFLVVPLLAGPATALENLRQHQAWAWLYGVNVFDGLRGAYSLPYIDHFWSLAVEEHFYFVWPLVVWLLAARPRALMGVSLAVGLLALVTRAAASMAGVSPVTVFVLTPFRLDGLCLGAFLAILVRQEGGQVALRRWLRPVALTAGALLVATFAFNRFSEAGVDVLRPVRGSLILVLLAALLLRVLMASPDSPLARLFGSTPMTFLGKYSYGLYVFHHFVSYYFLSHQTEFAVAGWLGVSHSAAVAAQAAAGIAVSIAVAWASYHLFEKHFLKLKALWS